MMNALWENLLAHWHRRAPRERLILAGGALLLALMLLYSLVWSPLAAQRQRLQQTLPQLRGQLAEMRSLANSVQGARPARSATPLRGATLQDAVQKQLNAQGLKTAKLELRSEAGSESISLQLNNIAFAQWAECLAQLNRQHGLQVREQQVTYLTAPAMVNVQATLGTAGGSAP